MQRILLAFLALFFLGQTAFAEAPKKSSPDAPQAIKACDGKNLLSTLPSKEKTKLQKKAATVQNGKGIFWKIEKDGVAPSWLIGTIHATDERAVNLKAPIKEHLEKADRVVLELAEIQDKKSMQSSMAVLMLTHEDLTYFSNGKSFEKEIPQEFKADIEAVLKNGGLKAEQLFLAKPWLVYTLFAYPKCENARQSAGLLVLDEKIAQIAKENLIPVRGLETIEEQFLSLASAPDNVVYELIAKSPKTDQSSNDLFETMVDTYLSEDIGILLNMNDVFKEYEVSKASEDIFNEILLTKRNHRMADRMVPMIELGNSFFAVGAAHLPDEEGIIALLRNKGFTVTRVALTK